MKIEEHKQRHKKLHKALDELMADFMMHTGKFISRTSLKDLMEWAFEQTKNPTDDEDTPSTKSKSKTK